MMRRPVNRKRRLEEKYEVNRGRKKKRKEFI